MTRTTIGLLTFGCLLAAGTPARAALIEWGYNWDRSPVAVSAGSGGVSLTNEPSNTARGNSDIVATDLQVFSSATGDTPDKFGPNGGKFTLTLTLNDLNGHTGVLSFQGQFGGKFTHDSANVTLTWLSATTQRLLLGADEFIVSMVSYSPPGPPSQHNLGSITSHINVAPQVVPAAPESSTLLLFGVGMVAPGLSAFRRRRLHSVAR